MITSACGYERDLFKIGKRAPIQDRRFSHLFAGVAERSDLDGDIINTNTIERSEEVL
jgi:hypothetical protein